MPLLELKVGLAGPAYVLEPGDEHEFSDYEAGRLIAAGFAEPVDVAPKPKQTRRKNKPNVVSG